MPLASGHEMVYIKRADQSGVALAQISDTNESHGSCQLRFEDLDEVLDAFLTVVDSVQEWPTHADSCGAEAHALQNVRTTTHTTVDEDLELREDGWAVKLALEECHDCWRGAGEILSALRDQIRKTLLRTYQSKLRPPWLLSNTPSRPASAHIFASCQH